MLGLNTRYKQIKAEFDIKVAKLEIDFGKKKLENDIKVEQYRIDRQKEIEVLAIACANDTKAYEHKFHSKMEELKSEIAKVKALKEIEENDIVTLKKLIEEKDKEIERINKLCLELAKKADVNIAK